MPARFLTVIRVAAALVGGLVLLSCEEPVELTIEQTKSRLVINSNFLPGEPVSLRISATRPVGGPVAAAITDAVVTLYEGDELAEELDYHTDESGGLGGHYRTKHFRPQVGQRYTVHVRAPGYDPVTAVSSIPEPVQLTGLQIVTLSSAVADNKLTYDFTLLVEYADPDHEVNYYDLRVYQRVTPYKLSDDGDTIRMSPYLKTVSTPAYEAGQAETISVLLQDRGPRGGVQVHLRSYLDPRQELLGEIVAELRTVSPEYYYFQRSLGPDLSGVSGGLQEPIILFNNVSSGLGIFAGYTSVQLALQLVASL
ncbi:DUF4249 domain-containing protein [Neolewinella sp.]|uniref:DUF4249 domain-containing protein n=1 Tax=Neolewinella sp. TaxID=2993543 RepID=UPI003B52CB3A